LNKRTQTYLIKNEQIKQAIKIKPEMFGLENCEGARLAVVAALGHVSAIDAVGLPLPPEGTPNATEDGAALPDGRNTAAAAVVIHSTNGGTLPIAAV
jgi:hypothetical protein